MRYYKKKSLVKRRKTVRKVRVARRSVTPAVKKYVKRTIHSLAENKVVNWTYNGDLLPYNAPASSWLGFNLFPLYPNSTTLTINQGTGEGQRVGNSISVRKAYLKFVVYPSEYNVSTNPTPIPQDIRMMIGFVKQNPVEGPTFTDFSELFQQGNTSAPPANSLFDMIQQVNKDSFTVLYDKIIKVGTSSVNGTGGLAAYQYMNNNDYRFNVVRKINITKYLTKKYGFNDTNNNPKSGRALFVWFLPCNAVGGTNVSTYKQSRIYIDVDISYEDI